MFATSVNYNSYFFSADYDFQVFEFLSVDNDRFKRWNDAAKAYNESRLGEYDESFQALLKACMTVDAHQLLISNRKNMNNMHSLQVTMCELM